MALTVTSLNGAITQNATLVRLTAFTNPSTAAIGPRTVAVVDGEKMLVTDATLSPTVQVVRGYDGTLAGPHNTLAPVVYGTTTDFTQTSGLGVLPVVSYGVSGAISIPTCDQTVYLTKAGVAAMTLADPPSDSTVTLKVVSLTAQAHTITYTAGFYGNTTSSDVATYPGTVGAAFTFSAKNGVWYAVATADDGVLIG